MAHEGGFGIFKTTVRLDHQFNHSKEHEVLNLTLFLSLLTLLLLLPVLLLLSFNLLINFCSLLLGQALLFVSLLLSLSWGEVVSRRLS